MAAQNSVVGGAVPVYNKVGKVVGEIRDGSLHKWNLDPQVHQLHRPRAWCTDADHLGLMRAYGATRVCLHTLDGETWSTTLDQFDCHGIAISRGFGDQVGLPLCYWERADPRRGRQLGFDFGGDAA